MFKRGKSESMTPVVAFLLNLPPRMRYTFAGIFLLGVMPPRIRNYKFFFERMFAPLQDMILGGNGTGLEVYDGFKERRIRLWFDVTFMVEDSKGLPNPLGCKGILKFSI